MLILLIYLVIGLLFGAFFMWVLFGNYHQEDGDVRSARAQAHQSMGTMGKGAVFALFALLWPVVVVLHIKAHFEE